jgi:putative endonuclease
MKRHLALGRAGEDAAARHLRSLGFTIVERNWRCGTGEIDVIAARGRLLVFCEVKARSSSAWGVPSEAVDPRKQARLRRLAGRWLAERRPRARAIRFDVISIVVRNGRAEVEHVENAF